MRQRFASFVRRASGRDGFIVVAVLWILTALATLATIFSVYVINTAMAFAVHDERLQAEGLMRAALELSAYQVAVNPQGPPSSGTLVFRIGNAAVNVRFMSETARIDLNTAPKELLSGLFADARRRTQCGRLLRRPHHRLALASAGGQSRYRSRNLSRRRSRLWPARRPVSAQRGTRPCLWNSRPSGRARACRS